MDVKEKHKWYNVRWFKRMAPVYDYIEFLVSSLRKKVANKIKDKNSKILDLACGTGNQSIAFAKRGFSVVGIDLSPDMLRYANKKIKSSYKLKFIYGDATKIDYKNSTFDASSISFGLHDMPEEIGLMILKEMIRTTKKNGQIIIVDYHKPRNKMIAWIGFRIAKLWESKYYDHFMNVGLERYLKAVNLKPLNKETHLLGNMQIVECKNIK
ncbi:hypothetical protein COV20_06130 [Candidatus Woesearchaeota archaeon CG10_big_fil_rev_8_21_14_0_10_45_16]|nr:MAG: hypothetical protein COV20_06130 [Candidatus Woesearchaeota archaeon CG10_big_fil_rev_8_21_14_0_10_45_16]